MNTIRMQISLALTIGLTISTIAVFSVSIVAQENEPKPRISESPLTPEQVAIYRSVLKRFTKGAKSPLNIADRTDLLDPRGFGVDVHCFEEIGLDPNMKSDSVVHRLDRSVLLNPTMVLVDPDTQEKKVEENDPQNLMKSAIDGHEAVSEKEVDKSVEQAFRSGLFTLSEIILDKGHNRAIVSYSFHCGRLCGNGNTLLLKRTGKNWKVSKTCGGYVS